MQPRQSLAWARRPEVAWGMRNRSEKAAPDKERFVDNAGAQAGRRRITRPYAFRLSGAAGKAGGGAEPGA